jgi:hypothetical protein
MGMDIPLLFAFLLAGASAFLFHLSLKPKRQVCPSCSTKMDVIGRVGILGAVYECPSCHFASDFNTVDVGQSLIGSLFFRFLGFFFSLKWNKPRWHARYMKLKSQIMHADIPLGYYLVLPITLFALWQFSLANELMRSMYMVSFLAIFPFQMKKHHCDVCGKQTDGKIMQMKNGHKRYFCSEKCELEYVAKPLVEEQLVDSTRRKALKALGLAGLFGAGLLTGKLSDVIAASPATPAGVVNGWAEVGSASAVVFADNAGYYYVKDAGAGLSQASPQIGQLIVNQNVITSYGASLGAGTAGASTTTAGIQEAVKSLPNGGKIFIKAGTYVVGTISLTPNIVLEGEGSGWQTKKGVSRTILQLANAVNGDVLNISGTNVYGIIIRDLDINGNKANQTAGHGIDLTGSISANIENVYILGANQDGIHADGSTVTTQWMEIRNAYIEQCGGNGIYLNQVANPMVLDISCDNNGADGFGLMNVYVGWFSHLAAGVNSVRGFNIENGFMLVGNAFFAEANLGRGIFIYNCANCTFHGLVGRVNGQAPPSGEYAYDVWISGTSTSYGTHAYGLEIWSNLNNVSGLYIGGSGFKYPRVVGGKIQLTGTGTTGIYVGGDSTSLNYLIRDVSIEAATLTTIEAAVSGQVKFENCPNYPTKNGGTSTFSGNGTVTQFTIPHGLVQAPTKVSVTPASANASGSFYVTFDATNIYVNYATAPPAGTNNVVLSWEAEV